MGGAALAAARGSFASIAAWLGLGVGLRWAGSPSLADLIELPWRLVCHQLPGRTLSLAGAPLPLCSRCLGLWAGASVAAALAWPPVPARWLRWAVPAALGLMGVEVATQELGLHPVWHPTRLLSGLLVSVPVGGAMGALITRELRGDRGRG